MPVSVLHDKFLGQPVALQLGLVVLFNTAIAVLLSLVAAETGFWSTFFASQCIGLSVFLSFLLFGRFFPLEGWRVAIPLVAGSVFGVLMVVMVMGLAKGNSLLATAQFLSNNYEKILVNVFLGVFFGGIITYYFFTREQQFKADRALQEERIQNLHHQKRIAETHLQLLQAQVEPHFLFNSLSNAISLIATDPARASLMLESLSRFLRASLSRSRDHAGSLADELALIENYLGVIQVRMGSRLGYQIDAPESLRGHLFPIMLLQPLVENAIRHGLEPLSAGGTVRVVARHEADMLRISVIDDGVGLHGEGLSGFGLYNVRQRLLTQFGQRASLKLEDNRPHGLCATIEIPYA